MKTSETWNPGFEDMRFDIQNGHVFTSEDALSPGLQLPFIFESQELPIELAHLPSKNQNQPEYFIYPPNPDSNSGRGQQPYEYSQTEHGQSTLEVKKEEVSQLEDKSMKVLDISHNSNPAQEQMRNREARSPPPLNVQPQLNVLSFPNPQNQKPQQAGTPSHYPNPNMNQMLSDQFRPLPANEIQNLALTVQQSYAPSQKTIVMSHAQGLAPSSPIYRSHVATERLQSQASDRPDKRMMTSPNAKGNNERNQMGWQEGGVKSMVNGNLQIPQNVVNERNLQMSEAQWWRDKYEQLRHQFQTYQARNIGEWEVASNRIITLEQVNQHIKQSYQKLANEYRKRVQETNMMKQQMAKSPKGQPQGIDPEIKRQIEERGMLINLLKKESLQIKQELQHKTQECSQLQVYNQDLQQNISVLKMELEQREEEIIQSRRAESAIKQNDISQFSRSRVHSLENTKIMDLQMQAGRLMTEIDQQRKMNAIKFKELVEKYESTVTEKDQIIRNLQEKAGILESDLNKKDSLLRNLRDELVEVQRKKMSPVHNSHVHTSPLHSTTSASAINPPIERSERVDKEEAKRQIDNLRKHLFDKERELTIQNQRQEELRQILSQTENTASRRKTEMQTLRRQISEQEDKLAELDLLRETLEKKNEQIGQLRETLIEKEYSGQYESLSKENQKLREISIKRNAEISDLNDRLLAAQKKIREQESYNPQIEALEEQVQMLSNHIRSQQSEIQRLTVSLEHSNQKVLEAELQIEKQRERQTELQNLLSEDERHIEELAQNAEKGQQKEQLLERQLESLASKMVKVQKQNEELKRSEGVYREQVATYQKELANRTIELQTVSYKQNQLQILNVNSLKQIEGIQQKLHYEISKKNQDINFMTARIRELEVLTKFQKDKLAKMEPEFEIFKEKQMKHQFCEKTINDLTEKVASYEMKILSSPHARQLFHHMPASGGKVFENRLIYQLKNQNQNLKTNLKRATSPASQSISTAQPEIMMRLNQFANRLQETLSQDKSLRKVKSQETLFSNQKTQDLQMQAFDKEEAPVTVLPVASLQQLQKFYNQKMFYYKRINEQLQERNNTLIKMNQELKVSLSHLTASKSQELKLFYEKQLRCEIEKNQKLEKQLTSSKKQLKKIQNQLLEMKRRSQKFESPESVSYSYKLREQISEWHQ